MVFSLRIVNADFYTATPLPGLDPVYSDFRSSKTDKVPVIRIFGSTLNGQKTCLHIHGVFPYICVPYDGGQPTDKYLKQFATSVDFALHVSQGKASSSSRHVHDVEIVTGRAIDLLQNGAVMNKTYQAYESHIPYIQQMFIDYNLYGMNLLNSSSVLFRTPIQLKQDDPAITAMHDDSLHSPTTPVLSPSSNTGSQSNKFWTEETVLSHYRHNEDVERLSICELEVDVKAEHILNQFDIGTSIGTNPGLMAIWKDERQRRKDENDDTALSPPLSQGACAVEPNMLFGVDEEERSAFLESGSFHRKPD
ncbi:hypothetical protein QZH41_003011 [Actinostola sp. cb2023]|nr:hypothetical protein QZH41_003011 [Actinostola sp. cb2023]